MNGLKALSPPLPASPQVENQEGVENFDAILAKTDSIMVRVMGENMCAGVRGVPLIYPSSPSTWA